MKNQLTSLLIHIVPSLPLRNMYTAPVKSILQDRAVPTPMRAGTSHHSHDIHNFQALNTENYSPVGKILGGNSRNFMTPTGRTPTGRKYQNMSREPLKEGKSTKRLSGAQKFPLRLSPSLVKKIQHASSKCDIPNTSIACKRHDNSPNSSSNTAKVTAVYKCELCSQYYTLGYRLLLHIGKTHPIQKAPLQCAKCRCAFSENIGKSPSNDCCLNTVRTFLFRFKKMLY